MLSLPTSTDSHQDSETTIAAAGHMVAELERRRAALHRRSAALRAPTNPADEVAFLAEFDAIEREAADVEAAMRLAGLAKA
jgi:hypothetical protein